MEYKPDKDLDFLHSIYPDKGKSAVRSHQVSSTKEYDLQIIVPVYNQDRFVKSCIDSVLCQVTRCNYIVTIINDGSTDRSSEILDSYKGNPQIEMINQENKGISGARNSGLNCLKGRYVMFLDSDDELAEGSIQSLYEYFSEEMDVIGGGYYTMTAEGENMEKISPKSNKQHSFPWGKAIKSELFSSIYFPECYWFEDTIMPFIVFPLAEKMINIDVPLYRYRQNPSGITFSSRGNPKILDTLYVTLRLLQDRSLLGIEPDAAYYDSLLYQIRINQYRLSTLKNRDVEKAAFRLLSDIIIRCNGKTGSKRLRGVERAVFQRSFSAFLWACNN